jgi:hypothetical protein
LTCGLVTIWGIDVDEEVAGVTELFEMALDGANVDAGEVCKAQLRGPRRAQCR